MALLDRKMDVRLAAIIAIVIIVFVFYALIGQYDDSVFNPINVSDRLQIFMSSNKQNTHHKPPSGIDNNQTQIITQALVPINIADRINSPYVVVGYCCQEPPGIYTRCEPQKFVTDIAEGTFLSINKQIIYQQCTKSGTAPKFMIDPYIQTQPSLPPNITRSEQIWYLPDILLCQGYFYDDSIIHHRSHLSQSQQISINIDEQMKLYHHLDVPYDIDNYDKNAHADINNIKYADNLKYSIRLSRSDNRLWQHHNRSFLTTYNTEFWGGGRCKRYDIIFESVFDRTLHGCVTVYIPPAFYFESERMHNNTEQLILPPDIVYNGDNQNEGDIIKFTPKQQEYINSILSFKDKDKFALFLVRDCYKSKYHIDAVLRPIFFDMLSSEYKNATSLGGCRRNWAVHKELGWKYCPKNSFNGHYMNRYKYNCSGYGWTDGVVQMARPYKFFITFENSKIKGYSTEKIFNALYSNAVPIYFGDPMITQYLNKNKFIHCNTITNAQIKEIRKLDKNEKAEKLIEIVKPMVWDNMMECVEKVKAVDQNDELYYKMLLEPVFVNNTYRNTVIDPAVIGEKMRYALKLHDSYLVKDVEV